VLKETELVLATRFDLANKRVWVYGGRKPTSETFMHHMIYQNFAARAVVHAHTREIVESEKLSHLRTPDFHEEGTLALANAAIEKLNAAGSIVILKDHGVLAYGSSLPDAAQKIVDLSKKG
jgi:ribulose-5-phosphate 4-epimerase/fuculose-1-phosphate aldolase